VNDFAGSVGALPYADLKATASLNYRNGPFSGLVQARYTDDGYQSACGEPGNCVTRLFYQDNSVPAVTYVDLRFAYDFALAGADLQVSANVTNLFDVDPPITPSYVGLAEHALQHNASVYDILGRRYTLGVRLKM
jgi:iron complex outermembrane receptor protein